jgi:hypothetical protein
MEQPNLPLMELTDLEPEEKVRLICLQLALWFYRSTGGIVPSNITSAADDFEAYIFNYQEEPPTDGGTEVEKDKPKLEVIEGGKVEDKKWFTLGSK